MGGAGRAFDKKKKELETALEQVRGDGQTDHLLILDVWKARKINAVAGFAIISPWQIKELDEEWLAVFDGLYGLQREQEESARNKREFEALLQKRRAAHPSYMR